MEQSYVIRNDRVIGKTVPNINYNYSTCPIGSIFAFSSERIPFGFFICNGAEISRAEYADLFAVIGTTYGEGDGSTTFNLPNLIDKFIQGSNISGTEIEAGLPNIEGKIEKTSTNTGDNFLTDNTVTSLNTEGALSITTYRSTKSMANGDDSYNTPVGFKFDASKANPIYGNSDTVQPPALTMVYIIKAFHTNEGTDAGVSDDVVEYVDSKIYTKGLVTNAQNFKIDITKNNAAWYGFFKLEYLYGAELCQVDVGITNTIEYRVIKGKNHIDKITYTIDGANIVLGIDFIGKVYGVQVVEMPIEFGTINSLTDETYAGDTTATFQGCYSMKSYSTLAELGLDTTATIDDIIAAMANGSMFVYKTDVFDYATQYENLQYATVTITKHSTNRVQALMTDKDTGNLYVGRLDSNNKVFGWTKMITEKSDPYACTSYTALTGTEDLFTLPCGHYVSANINTAYNYPITDSSNATAHIYVLGHLNDPANNKGYRIILYFDNKDRMYRINEWWGSFDNGWQEIATKTVADVGFTTINQTNGLTAPTGITMTDSSKVNYCIRNGICYVHIALQISSISAKVNSWTVIAELPKSVIEAVGAMNCESNTVPECMPIRVSQAGKLTLMYKGTTTSTSDWWSYSFSYPVAK